MNFYEERITMGEKSNHIRIKYNDEVLYDGIGKLIHRMANCTKFIDENDKPRIFNHGMLISTI